MARRKTILANNETYHVFNRSSHDIPIFKRRRESQIFIEALHFYLQETPPTRFSIYRTSRDRYSINLENKLVNIINYCLMPNHFHLTLRQKKDDGIRKFVQRVSNSFAHYYNVKHKSRGPVFEGNFKAVRISSNEQLIHLSRYIHLNPVTSYLVKNPKDYPYSSYKTYLKKEESNFVEPSLVISQFSSLKDYERFTLSQKNYQRKLNRIKHLLFEDSENFTGS